MPKKTKPITPPEGRPTIAECPAYGHCRDKKISCDICESLDVAAWAEHVKKVLAKNRQP